jgi:hypothetical protein
MFNIIEFLKKIGEAFSECLSPGVNAIAERHLREGLAPLQTQQRAFEERLSLKVATTESRLDVRLNADKQEISRQGVVVSTLEEKIEKLERKYTVFMSAKTKASETILSDFENFLKGIDAEAEQVKDVFEQKFNIKKVKQIYFSILNRALTESKAEHVDAQKLIDDFFNSVCATTDVELSRKVNEGRHSDFGLQEISAKMWNFISKIVSYKNTASGNLGCELFSQSKRNIESFFIKPLAKTKFNASEHLDNAAEARQGDSRIIQQCLLVGLSYNKDGRPRIRHAIVELEKQ